MGEGKYLENSLGAVELRPGGIGRGIVLQSEVIAVDLSSASTSSVVEVMETSAFRGLRAEWHCEQSEHEKQEPKDHNLKSREDVSFWSLYREEGSYPRNVLGVVLMVVLVLMGLVGLHAGERQQHSEADKDDTKSRHCRIGAI